MKRKSLISEKHLDYYKLLEAFQQDGCPVCLRLSKVVLDYLDMLLYENVNDPDLRQRLRLSLGFCQRHAENLKEFGDGLGIAIIYEDLLRMVKSKMARSYLPLTPKEKCPICALVEKQEVNILNTFVNFLPDEEFRQSFEQTSGLCLPHLSRVFIKIKDEDARKFLITFHLEKLEILNNHLSEFIRKHDYRFKDEKMTKEESVSWQKVLHLFAGENKSMKR